MPLNQSIYDQVEIVPVSGPVPVDLVQPLLDIVEALQVSGIVHHDDAVSASVVGRCYRAEPLLSGSVPLYFKLIQNKKRKGGRERKREKDWEREREEERNEWYYQNDHITPTGTYVSFESFPCRAIRSFRVMKTIKNT